MTHMSGSFLQRAAQRAAARRDAAEAGAQIRRQKKPRPHLGKETLQSPPVCVAPTGVLGDWHGGAGDAGGPEQLPLVGLALELRSHGSCDPNVTSSSFQGAAADNPPAPSVGPAFSDWSERELKKELKKVRRQFACNKDGSAPLSAEEMRRNVEQFKELGVALYEKRQERRATREEGSSPAAQDATLQPPTTAANEAGVDADAGADEAALHMGEEAGLQKHKPVRTNLESAGMQQPLSWLRTTRLVSSLAEGEVFVFGSNEAGRHGKGAAKTARQWGASLGQAEGRQGATYAIPTKVPEHGPSTITITITTIITITITITITPRTQRCPAP